MSLRTTITILFISAYVNGWSQVPTIDGDFCEPPVWGTPIGQDILDDTPTGTADVADLYLVIEDDVLYWGWSRDPEGAGTSSFNILADGNCDGETDIIIGVSWGTGNPLDIEINGTTLTQQALQGESICGDPTTEGFFLEYFFTIDDILQFTDFDPCDCACGAIEITNAGSFAGGSFNSAQRDEFDILNPVGIELFNNDCPVADFTKQFDETCVETMVLFDGSLTMDSAPDFDSLSYVWDFGDGSMSTDISPIHTYITPGTYTVSLTVTDLYGCTDMMMMDIIINPAVLSTCSFVSDVVCNGESNGSATVTPMGGNGNFTFLWDNGETTATATMLNAGIHFVTVTDGVGCTAICSAEIGEPLELTASCTLGSDVVCNGESNGIASVTSTGGNGGNTFLWDNGEVTTTATGLNAGTHFVTVTDLLGCTAVCSVLVGEPAILTATCTLDSDVMCNGESNGVSTISTTGGNGGNTFLWDNGETTATASGLDAGTHSVTVTDMLGCTAVCSVDIGEPAILTASCALDSDVVCNGENNGIATISSTGGNGGNTFLWDNGETTATATGLDAGIHSVTVTDILGCTAECTVEIGEPAILTATCTLDSDVVCNGESNGVATVTSTGGNGGNTFLWDNGETTATATGLDAGTHIVTITDNLGCTATCSIVIGEPAILIATCTLNSDVVCNGESNGVATVTSTGGNGGNTILWDNGETTAIATGLNAGTHVVTVTDALGCTATCSVVVGEPAILTATCTLDTDVICNGESNGVATLSTTGGNGGNTILWDNGETTATASGLDAGTHTVTVTDALGCMATCSVIVGEPAVLTATCLLNSDVVCNGESNGVATVSSTGGNGGNTFLWDNGETTATATGLNAGTHVVTITDALGCTATCSVVVGEPAILTASCTLDSDVLCNGESNGVATVSSTGGNGGTTFLWDNGETTATATGLDAGTHFVTVTDALACTAICSVLISEPLVLSSSISGADVSCNAFQDGSIDLTVTGGTMPFTYNWSNGLPSTQDQGAVFAGMYSVTITDANACTTTNSITINEPPQIILLNSAVTDVLCVGEATGMIDITIDGGTPAYQYMWSDGVTTEDRTNLTAGNYTVQVQDQNGCTITFPFTVTEPDPIAIDITIGCEQTFFPGCDAVLAYNITGGFAPYTVVLTDENGMVFPPNEAGPNWSNLCDGQYDITVTDAAGCETTESFLVCSRSCDLSINQDILVNVSCNGFSDGSATILGFSSFAPIDYVWELSGMQIGTDQAASLEPITMNNLVAGVYKVIATDAIGCMEELTFVIDEPQELVITTCNSTAVTTVGGADGTSEIFLTGGTPSYTFLWSDGQTTNPATNLAPGIYTVTATDANGCIAEIACTVQGVDCANFDASSNKMDISCNGGNDGEISVSVVGATGNISYTWNPNVSATNIATGLNAGLYEIMVVDDALCTELIQVTLTEPTLLTAAIDKEDVICFGEANGNMDLQVSGGIEPFTFLWSNGVTTEDQENLGPGTYTVTVTDANDCTVESQVTVNQPDQLTVSAAVVNVLCNGEATGELDITIQGGIGPYFVMWSDNVADEDRTDLLAGNYTVLITDQNGCQVLGEFTITQPEPIAIDITIGCELTFFPGCDAVLDYNITGGLGPYNVTLTDENGMLVIPNEAGPNWSNLCDGQYDIIVVDASGCATTESFLVCSRSCDLSIDQDILVNVSCNGFSDGSATIVGFSSFAPIDYVWESAGMQIGTDQAASLEPVSMNNLVAGVYKVIATDAIGCMEELTFVIDEPQELVITSCNSTAVTTVGGSDGTSEVFIIGGTPAYSYLWSDGQTSNPATGLPPGIFTVTVTDANGCTAEIACTVQGINCANFDASSNKIDISCNGGSDGEISIFVVGATGNVTYTWLPTISTTNMATGLSAGFYEIMVVDEALCTELIQITLTEPTLLTAAIDKEDVICFGEANGNMDLQVSGGIEPFTFLWSNGIMTEDQENLGPGLYSVTVTDANDCTVQSQVTVNQPDQLAVTGVIENVLCTGELTGGIDISIQGGIGPYFIMWSDNITDEDRTNLPAGNYSVLITDQNGCQVLGEFTITQPEPLAIDITIGCELTFFPGCDAALDYNITGGLAPYTLTLTDENGDNVPADEAGPRWTSLCAGQYDISVTDASGCATTESFLVCSRMCDLSINQDVLVNVSCNQFNDGSATIIGFSSFAPIDYVWELAGSQIGTEQAGSSEPIVMNNLEAGVYKVIAIDAIGCREELTFVIDEPQELVITTCNSTPVTVLGGADGTAEIFLTGGTPDYTYLWSDGQTTNPATGLTAGIYTVTTTDQNGCVASISCTVQGVNCANFDASANKQDVTCNGENEGQISISVIGATGNVTYTWTPTVSTSNTATNLAAGQYEVVIVDDALCTELIQITITEPTLLNAAIDKEDVICFGENNGTMDLQVSGGVEPFTFSWSNGVTTEDQEMLPPNNYTVTVTDANGCTVSSSVIVEEPTEVLCSTIALQNANCDNSDGSAQVFVQGGISPYSIQWDNGETTETATMLSSGSHNVTVVDQNGCTKICSVIVGEDCAEPGSISGTVTEDEDFNSMGDIPLPNVTITLINSEGDTLTTTTDENGDYSFEDVPVGPFTLIETDPDDYFSVMDVDGGDPNIIMGIVTSGEDLEDQDFIDGICEELVCNNDLQISLNVACELILTGDMLLEQAPIGAEFDIMLYNEHGDYIRDDTLTAAEAGEEILYQISCQDNSCWGHIIVEANIIPQLTSPCECTEDGSISSECTLWCGPSGIIPASLITPEEATAQFGECGPELVGEIKVEEIRTGDLCDPDGEIVQLVYTGKILQHGVIRTIDILCQRYTTVKLDVTEETFEFPQDVILDCNYLDNIDVPEGEDPVDFILGEPSSILASTGSSRLSYPTFVDMHDTIFNVISLYDTTSVEVGQILRDTTVVEIIDGEEIWVSKTIVDKIYEEQITERLDTIGKTNPVVPVIDRVCNVLGGYSDVEFDACGEGLKIVRTWNVIDWCDSDVILSSLQTIEVIDVSPPVIVESVNGELIPLLNLSDITASIEPWACSAKVQLPQLTILDNCDASPQVQWYTTEGEIQGGYLVDLWLNQSPVLVEGTVLDDCGNETDIDFSVMVVDDVPPVPICEIALQVSLTNNGVSDDRIAKIYGRDLDEGSHDNGCGKVRTTVIRVEDWQETVRDCQGNVVGYAPRTCAPTTETIDLGVAVFKNDCDTTGVNLTEVSVPGEFVTFCCEDYGKIVQVILFIEDEGGNVNQCMVNVEVVDKSAPTLVCQDAVVSCAEGDYLASPAMVGAGCERENPYEVELLSESRGGQVCAGGQTVREWFIDLDGSGDFSSGDAYCHQIVTVTTDSAFNPATIKWPKNYDGKLYTNGINIEVNDEGEVVEIPTTVSMGDPAVCTPDDTSEGSENGAGPSAGLGIPVWCDTECGLVGYSMNTDTIKASEACLKIIRRWTVVDWCTYDANSNNQDHDNDSATDQYEAVEDWAQFEPDAPGCPAYASNSGDAVYFRYKKVLVNGVYESQVDRDGYYTYDQIIVVNDDTAPEIDGPATYVVNTTGGASSKDDATDCTGSDVITAYASDLCDGQMTGSKLLQWQINVSKDGQVVASKTVRGQEASMNSQVGSPGDTHVITWRVKDGCGNASSAQTIVTFGDQQAPTPFCVSGLTTAFMASDGAVTIWGAEFDLGSFDNCTATEDLRFTLVKSGEEPIRPGGDGFEDQTGITFNCGQLENYDELDMWVWDELGNGDYCEVGITISDNGNECSAEGEVDGGVGSSATIAGEVRTYYDMMIDNVIVSAEASGLTEYPKFDMSSFDGQFAFRNNPTGFNYQLTAEKDDDYLSGVSTLDLVFIQRHILGLASFESPYQIIASDASADGRVSALDMNQIRQLIIGNVESLDDSDPWLFLDASHSFFDVENPWPFTEGIDISNLLNEQMNEDFIGLKIGDVNQSYQGAESRSDEILSLNTSDVNMVSGQIAKVAIRADELTDLMGYQFSLSHTGLRFKGVESGLMIINEQNLGIREDVLTMSWNQAIPLSTINSDVLFTIEFEAQSELRLSEALILNSSVTKAEAYIAQHGDFEVHGIELIIGAEDDTFILYQNQPNPFVSTTIIGFNLPAAGNATLTIVEVDGKEVKVIKGTYSKGYNEIQIDQKDLRSSGILYYQLVAGTMNQTRKMIVLE